MAKSVEGEDDIVDVSMQDAPEAEATEKDAERYTEIPPPTAPLFLK